MGLDQYAEVKSATGDIETFKWRKHARLQEFMEKIYRKRGGTGDFNLIDIELSADDIVALRAEIEAGYPDNHSEGGFFFGHERQVENMEYWKQQDLHFTVMALSVLAGKGSVTYSSWW